MRDGQQMLLDVLAWIETSCVEELQVKRPGSTQRCCTSTSYTLSSVAGDYVAVLYNLIPFDKKVAATAAPSWSRSTATGHPPLSSHCCYFSFLLDLLPLLSLHTTLLGPNARPPRTMGRNGFLGSFQGFDAFGKVCPGL